MGGPFESPASSSSNASGAARGGSYGDGTRGPDPSPSPGPSPGHGATRPGAYGDGTRGGGSGDAGGGASGGASRPAAWRDWSSGVPYRPSGASSGGAGGGVQTPSAGAVTGPGAFTGAGHDRAAATPAAPSRPTTGDGRSVSLASDGGAGGARKPAPGPARSRSGGGDGKATGPITGRGAGDVARARKIRDEAAAERRANDAAAAGRASAPTGPRPGAAPHASASAAAAKAPSAAKPASPQKTLSDEDWAELERTAQAMKRTTDISGFQDILDGAVAIDPDAAAREIGAIRELIAGSGLEGQLDAQLHQAMMKRVGTAPPPAGETATLTGGAGEDDLVERVVAERGDLLPGPAGETSTLGIAAGEDALFQKRLAEQGDLLPGPAGEALSRGSEAAEDAFFAKVAAAKTRQTPAAASFQGKERDGRVADPVALSQEEDRLRHALGGRRSGAPATEAEPPAPIRRPIEPGEEPREYFEGAHDWLFGDEISEPQSAAALGSSIDLIRWEKGWGDPAPNQPEESSPAHAGPQTGSNASDMPQTFVVPTEEEAVARLLRGQGVDPAAKITPETRLSAEEVDALMKDGGLSSLESAAVFLAPDGYYHRKVEGYHDRQAVHARVLELGRRHAIRFNRPLHEVLVDDMRFDYGVSWEWPPR